MKQPNYICIGLIGILLLLCLTVRAQVQQGYIRTINRPNRQPKPVANVTVTIGGVTNSMVTDAQGQFSFRCTGQSYRIMRIQKQGYLLIDKGVIGRQQPFSSTVRQEIVMVSQADLEADKKRIEERAYQRAQADYEKRLAEIHQQLAAQQLTEQEAAQAEVALGDNYQKFIEMIGDMAERYATMDYEGISDLNRQILQCIENAELERADSLINSKGSIEQRLQEVRQSQATLQAAQDLVQKAQQDYTFKLNDLAEDCYNKYTIFKSQYQNDSAAYYLEQRAALDTTNVLWQNQAGVFIDERLADYNLAMNYYQCVLRQSQLQYGEESDVTATGYNNIGLVYDNLGDYGKALEYHQKALAIREKVLGPEHKDLASSYNNIGLTYSNLEEYAKALEYYQKALTICEKVLGLEHPHVATFYNNIGSVYDKLGDSDKALEYYQKALAIREKVLGPEHPDVAISYNNFGTVYFNLGNYAKALEYFQKALDIREKVLGGEHLDLAGSYNNIGAVYYKLGDNDKALEYLQKALTIHEKVLGLEHPDVAQSYNNICYVYAAQGNYAMALEYSQKALTIYEKVLEPEHPDIKTLKENIEYARQKLSEQ